MSAASEPARIGRAGSLALRYALRELRGGLRGFYVFIACIALGVMAIAGVGSVAASLSEGLAREGRTLLGGDVAFSLFQREAKPEEIAFLRARGNQQYIEVYDVLHPLQQLEHPRGLRATPYHERLVQREGFLVESAGHGWRHENADHFLPCPHGVKASCEQNRAGQCPAEREFRDASVGHEEAAGVMSRFAHERARDGHH